VAGVEGATPAQQLAPGVFAGEGFVALGHRAGQTGQRRRGRRAADRQLRHHGLRHRVDQQDRVVPRGAHHHRLGSAVQRGQQQGRGRRQAGGPGRTAGLSRHPDGHASSGPLPGGGAVRTAAFASLRAPDRAIAAQTAGAQSRSTTIGA
jgi:hypothetical protein